MSEAVVDLFETVQIEVQQGELARAASGQTDGLGKPVVEQQAVRQTGQSVVVRDPVKPLCCEHMLGDVSGYVETSQYRPLGIDMRQQLYFKKAAFVVFELVCPVVVNCVAA